MPLKWMLLNNNGKETNKREGTNIFLVFFLFLVLCLLLANHDVNMLHVIHISFLKTFCTLYFSQALGLRINFLNNSMDYSFDPMTGCPHYNLNWATDMCACGLKSV